MLVLKIKVPAFLLKLKNKTLKMSKMKVFRILLILPLFFLISSCAKEKDSVNELPVWLQERIAADEEAIAADGQTGLDLGAWIQYTYKENIYFEYHNLIMSSLPKVYSFNGDQMPFDGSVYTEYQKAKCCKKFVWKGKSYFED